MNCTTRRAPLNRGMVRLGLQMEKSSKTYVSGSFLGNGRPQMTDEEAELVVVRKKLKHAALERDIRKGHHHDFLERSVGQSLILHLEGRRSEVGNHVHHCVDHHLEHFNGGQKAQGTRLSHQVWVGKFQNDFV